MPTARSTTSTNNTRPASLARRLLFPHLHPTADLPPLFLSPELNDEIYDFIALALRAFVNTWWTKLTRYDKELLPQIASILTHVIRSLERRVLDADLALLVYVDFPALVTQHYRDYRQAASKASTSYATGGALSHRQLFHQLQPHMAVSADGTIDEEYFRQAFDHVLKECLPSEDYAPETERFIIRELVLKIVVKDVIPLMAQPWFLQRMALDALGPEQTPVSASGDSRLSKSSVIVLLLSAIQRLSGTCIMLIHAYKQAIYMIPVINQTSCSRTRSPSPLASATPSVSPASSTVMESKPTAEYPDLTHGILAMVSEVLHAQDRLATGVLIQFVSLFCCAFQTFMNKLSCYVLYTHVLSASTILSVVRLSKRTLFPNGYPGPPPVDPTAEEQAAMRERLAKRVGDVVVDPLSDWACNVHLAVFVLDALLLSVFPEMGPS